MNEHVDKLYNADHSKGKERFHKMAMYIFYIYDKRSIYRSMSLEERRKLVCKDILQEPGYWRKAEQNPTFQEVVSRLNKIQFTHKERLLEGVKEKIDQYLLYFNTMKLGEKNEKQYKRMVKGSKELLELHEELEMMVNKEAQAKIVGGGETKLFEDE